LRNLRKRQSPDVQRSLFGEILDWMLAPLLFVWPISIAFTHYFANSVASFPYDQSLREHVSAIARQVSFDEGYPQLALPGIAQVFLRSDEIDNVYFHLLDVDGSLIVGDTELPVPRHPARVAAEASTAKFFFVTTSIADRRLRVAYMYLFEPGASAIALGADRSRRDDREALATGKQDHSQRDPAAVRDHSARRGAGLVRAVARLASLDASARPHPGSPRGRPLADRTAARPRGTAAADRGFQLHARAECSTTSTRSVVSSPMPRTRCEHR
jgi:hypothetical protein